MWARLSIKFKLTTLVVCIVAIASWSFGRIAFRGLLDMLETSTGLRAQTAAEALAATIDPGQFDGLIPGEREQAEYRRLASLTERLLERNRFERVYLFKLVGEDHLAFLLSLPADESRDHYPPGTVLAKDEAGRLMRRTEGFGPLPLVHGLTMGGWAEVDSGSGQMGVLVVAIDASDMQRVMDTAAWVVFIAMVAFVLLTGILAYKLSASFEKTAVTDGLMGIYNHKYFKQRLAEEVSKAARYRQQTALVMLDIDHFKHVNDTYGHATGDMVLKSLARWTNETCRNTDVIARYGGEEVAVILPHTGLAGAQEFAERLRIRVSEQTMRDTDDEADFRVTISVGVAQWEKGLTPADLIRRADTALYQSKNGGRNRVTLYRDELLPRPAEAGG